MCDIVLLLAMIEEARRDRTLAIQISAALWFAAFLHSPGITPSPAA